MRDPVWWRLPAAVTSLLSVGWLLLAGAGAAAAQWHEGRSDHFLVRSDAGLERTTQLAGEMERVRRVVQAVLPEMDPREERLRVLALRSGRDLVRLFPEYGPAADPRVGGAFLSGSRRDQIVLRLDVRERSLSAILYHEYVHSLARHRLRDLPSCLSEGLAALFSTVIIEREEKGERVVVGEPHPTHVRTLDGIALDPPAALRASRLDGRARPGLAAQCWALAHRLLVGAGGADREAFVRYVEDQLSGVDEAVAWQRHLGHVAAGADSSERGAGTLTVTLPGSPVPEVEARRLGPAEVDALLGELLLDRGRPTAARPLLESALSADPSQPVALAAMGRLARLEGSLALAVAMSRRALETDPDDRAVAAELASALLARESEAPSRELAEVEELLALLARSGSEIEPPWIELAAIYARSDRESRGDFSRTVSVCRLAVTSEPSSSWRRLLLARALLIGGAVEQARRTAREAAALATASTDPVAANNVCWYGAVGGLAAGVAAACDRAVVLRPQRGLYRDSRAVVRALTGDLAGAAEDLRVFLGSADASPPAIRAQRSTWLEELERGESPFDEGTLAALSDLPF